jgi:hypothetical protein
MAFKLSLALEIQYLSDILLASAVTNTTTIDSFKRYIGKFLEHCQHQLKDQIHIRINLCLQSSLTKESHIA